MITDNMDKFFIIYREELEKSHKAAPEKYAWSIEEINVVFDWMKNAVIRGFFNKDSPAFRATCKRLKIKHTYRDIKTYLGAT